MAQLSECPSDFDHQRVVEDWNNPAVKKTIRVYKSERHLTPFLQRLQLLNYDGMDCFQDIFLDAAKLHFTQLTENTDKQVASAYRVLTSILGGYQTADKKGYTQWVAELGSGKGANAKAMLHAMLTQHGLSSAYYMLG